VRGGRHLRVLCGVRQKELTSITGYLTVYKAVTLGTGSSFEAFQNIFFPSISVKMRLTPNTTPYWFIGDAVVKLHIFGNSTGE
jgi:hypothetical protein